jgi:hypothetical protein
VPSPALEAARHLCRAREQVRSDLMRCRHRVSKLLLLHGRVYPQPTTCNERHRRWLTGQRFEDAVTELAYLDTLATVDGLVAGCCIAAYTLIDKNGIRYAPPLSPTWSCR